MSNEYVGDRRMCMSYPAILRIILGSNLQPDLFPPPRELKWIETITRSHVSVTIRKGIFTGGDVAHKAATIVLTMK